MIPSQNQHKKYKHAILNGPGKGDLFIAFITDQMISVTIQKLADTPEERNEEKIFQARIMGLGHVEEKNSDRWYITLLIEKNMYEGMYYSRNRKGNLNIIT